MRNSSFLMANLAVEFFRLFGYSSQDQIHQSAKRCFHIIEQIYKDVNVSQRKEIEKLADIISLKQISQIDIVTKPQIESYFQPFLLRGISIV